MKIKELKKLPQNKLQEKLVEMRNKSRELRFSIANNQLKDVRKLREVKKIIAKILTLLNQSRIVKEKTIVTDKAKKVEDKQEK